MYLNLDFGYFTSIKTMRLVGILGKGSDILPIRLWTYVGMHHSAEGLLQGYSDAEIERIIDWWGEPGAAVEAMLKVGFLERRRKGLQVHGWKEHQGHIEALKIRGRKAAEKRWKKAETEYANEDEVDNKQKHNGNAGGNAQAMPKQCSFPSSTSLPSLHSSSDGSEPFEGSSPEDPVFISLTLNTGDEHPIMESFVVEMEKIYPGVDVRAKLRRMRGWCLANSKNRKTAGGVLRFVNNWLSKEQDKSTGGLRPGSGNGAASPRLLEDFG